MRLWVVKHVKARKPYFSGRSGDSPRRGSEDRSLSRRGLARNKVTTLASGDRRFLLGGLRRGPAGTRRLLAGVQQLAVALRRHPLQAVDHRARDRPEEAADADVIHHATQAIPLP